MRFSFPSASRRFVALGLLSLPLAGVPACEKSSSSGGATGACPYPWDDGGLGLYESTGSGSVKGSSVGASFCNIGVTIQENGGQGSQGPYTLTLDSSTLATISAVSLPADAVAGTITGSVQIAAATPGVYKSSDSTACGAFQFSYGVPVSPNAGCAEADAQAGCPTGCTFTNTCPPTSGFGCCVPLATTYIFQSSATTTNCGLGTGPTLGSWTLTLTGVFAVDGGDGTNATYVPHGSLEVTLQGTTGTSDPATFTLSF